ncbi:MAG: hypothetical protein ACREPM_11795, partial [Gemmatimonadaceae bacterium]
MASTLLHTGLVALAVWATARTTRASAKTSERVEAVELPPVARQAEPAHAPPAKPRGFQILQAPIDVPTQVPPVDFT